MRIQLPLVSQSYLGRSRNIDSNRLINLIPEKSGEDIYLYGSPGSESFCVTGTYGEVRGLFYADDLYAIVRDTIYKINSLGVATSIGTIGTLTGPVWIIYNGTQVMFVDGALGYTYTPSTSTFAQITDADFPIPSSLTYQDGYGIVTEQDTGKFFISALYDFTFWDALDFASAEGLPDNLVAPFMVNRELWMFGQYSTEIYYNSGDSDFPFARIQGAFIEYGCGAKASIAKGDNTVFWLDNFYQVRMAQGYSPKVISPPQINYQISQYATKDDAIGFFYTQEGHAFYVLTFPTQQATWVYDASTGLWHERVSYPLDQNGNYGRWRANCYAYAWDKHLIGDYENGTIYELKTDVYTDDSNDLPRIWYGSNIHKNNKWLFLNSLEMEFESGIGLEDGTDPQAMLQISRDGGHTFGTEDWVSMGQIGEYTKRAKWNRKGRGRNIVPKIVITDPIKTIFIRFYADMNEGLF